MRRVFGFLIFVVGLYVLVFLSVFDLFVRTIICAVLFGLGSAFISVDLDRVSVFLGVLLVILLGIILAFYIGLLPQFDFAESLIFSFISAIFCGGLGLDPIFESQRSNTYVVGKSLKTVSGLMLLLWFSVRFGLYVPSFVGEYTSDLLFLVVALFYVFGAGFEGVGLSVISDSSELGGFLGGLGNSSLVVGLVSIFLVLFDVLGDVWLEYSIMFFFLFAIAYLFSMLFGGLGRREPSYSLTSVYRVEGAISVVDDDFELIIGSGSYIVPIYEKRESRIRGYFVFGDISYRVEGYLSGEAAKCFMELNKIQHEELSSKLAVLSRLQEGFESESIREEARDYLRSLFSKEGSSVSLPFITVFDSPTRTFVRVGPIFVFEDHDMEYVQVGPIRVIERKSTQRNRSRFFIEDLSKGLVRIELGATKRISWDGISISISRKRMVVTRGKVTVTFSPDETRISLPNKKLLITPYMIRIKEGGKTIIVEPGKVTIKDREGAYTQKNFETREYISRLNHSAQKLRENILTPRYIEVLNEILETTNTLLT